MSREIELERLEISKIIAKNFKLNDEQYDASDFEWAACQLQQEGFHKQSKNTIELLEKQLAFWKNHASCLSKALDEAEKQANLTAELLDKTEEELNAERVKQEWISVDERLPDKAGTYLVYTDKDNITMDIFCIYPSHGTKFWVGGINGEVTHWMPLPEAPKMKGGAE